MTDMLQGHVEDRRAGDYLIRSAARADIVALVDIFHRTWFTTWAPELPLSAVRAFVLDDPCQPYAESKWREFRVAAVEGRITGLCHVDDAYIAALHVDPKHQGRGIGAALLADAERRVARWHPVARLEVLAFNQRAYGFYLDHGWTEQGRYPASEFGAPVEVIEMAKSMVRPRPG